MTPFAMRSLLQWLAGSSEANTSAAWLGRARSPSPPVGPARRDQRVPGQVRRRAAQVQIPLLDLRLRLVLRPRPGRAARTARATPSPKCTRPLTLIFNVLAIPTLRIGDALIRVAENSAVADSRRPCNRPYDPRRPEYKALPRSRSSFPQQARTHEFMLRTPSGRLVGEAKMGSSGAKNVSLALTARHLPVDRGDVFVLWAGDESSSMKVGRT